MESQVKASFELAFHLLGLATTCIHLIMLKFQFKSMQVFCRLATNSFARLLPLMKRMNVSNM
jgi:hypothetical protein